MREVGGIGRDAAGKTGTTDGYTAAWFAGYTPNLASAVSLGDPRGAFTHNLIGVTIGGRYYSYVYGASISGRIWKQAMMGALKGVEPTEFAPVDHDRFGGCGDNCAPKPKKEKKADQGGPPDDFFDQFDQFNRDDNGRAGARARRRPPITAGQLPTSVPWVPAFGRAPVTSVRRTVARARRRRPGRPPPGRRPSG